MIKKHSFMLFLPFLLAISSVQAWDISHFASWLLGKKKEVIASTTANGITLRLQKGSLVKIRNIDIIVNAANPELVRGGGLCGALYEAAGSGLTQEIAARKATGSLPLTLDAGEAAITNSHNLALNNNIKKIIHAVGPNFNYKESKMVTLGLTYLASLRLAEGQKAHSIVFPPISAGIYRGDKSLEELALETFKALKHYIENAHKRTSAPHTIVIMLYSPAEIEAYGTAFKKIFSIKDYNLE